jgi:hypothetical protein
MSQILTPGNNTLETRWNDPQISKALGTYPIMCARVRRQWTEEGLDGVLRRKQRATPPTPPIFDGEKEAKLIALACSPPPAGRTGWTLTVKKLIRGPIPYSGARIPCSAKIIPCSVKKIPCSIC